MNEEQERFAQPIQIEESLSPRLLALQRRRKRSLWFASGTLGGAAAALVVGAAAGQFQLGLWFGAVVVGILVLLVGVLAFIYLEEEIPSATASLLSTSVEALASFGFPGFKISASHTDRAEILTLQASIVRLRNDIDRLKINNQNGISDTVIKQVSADIANQASAELVDRVERRISAIERSALYEARHAMESFAVTRERMFRELERLNRRGAINLILGGLITLGGATILWWFIIN